jgi:hypothetical protein
MMITRFAFLKCAARSLRLSVVLVLCAAEARADEASSARPTEQAAGAGSINASTSDERRIFLEGFAASLARERDYFRAITVWKELHYAHRGTPRAVDYALTLASTYRRANRYPSALSYVPLVLNSPLANEAQRARAELLGAESYLGLRIPFQAEMLLTQSLARLAQIAPGSNEATRAQLLLAATAVDSNEYAKGAAQFRSIAEGCSPYATLAAELEQKSLAAERRPYRSPLAAALLSAVLPGAGQAYSGHWVDAAQALFFVGAFGFASALAYSYEKDRDRPFVLTAIGLSLTSVFHVGNIVGAHRTARFYNERQRELSVDAIRNQVLSLP